VDNYIVFVLFSYPLKIICKVLSARLGQEAKQWMVQAL